MHGTVGAGEMMEFGWLWSLKPGRGSPELAFSFFCHLTGEQTFEKEAASSFQEIQTHLPPEH